MSTAVVIPSNREDSLKKFLEAWNSYLDECQVIVVEDNDKKTFSLPSGVLHYSHQEIAEDLGDKAWIIPHGNASIRSYGFYKAWQSKYDYIITLDDDCYPWTQGFINQHIDNLNRETVVEKWVSTVDGLHLRGLPYKHRTHTYETVISHGLWKGVPDLDAITQLRYTGDEEYKLVNQVIPVGKYFPMCGMNLAFKAKITPIMYFLLMGRDYEYDRYDDIWAGVIAKKICDHLKLGVFSGRPYVEHIKQSDVWVNLKKESTGYELNDRFWKAVDAVEFDTKDIIYCYKQVANCFAKIGNNYFNKLATAMIEWSELYA